MLNQQVWAWIRAFSCCGYNFIQNIWWIVTRYKLVGCSFSSWNSTCLPLGGKKKIGFRWSFSTSLSWPTGFTPCQSSTSRKYARLVMPADRLIIRMCPICQRRGKKLSVFCFSGRAFPPAAVHLSVSAARRRTLFIKVSVLQRHELLEGTLTDKISQKMERSRVCHKPPVLFLLQHESSRFGASLSPVRVRAGIPHCQTLLLHWWESSENVSGAVAAFWALLVLCS